MASNLPLPSSDTESSGAIVSAHGWSATNSLAIAAAGVRSLPPSPSLAHPRSSSVAPKSTALGLGPGGGAEGGVRLEGADQGQLQGLVQDPPRDPVQVLGADCLDQ